MRLLVRTVTSRIIGNVIAEVQPVVSVDTNKPLIFQQGQVTISYNVCPLYYILPYFGQNIEIRGMKIFASFPGHVCSACSCDSH